MAVLEVGRFQAETALRDGHCRVYDLFAFRLPAQYFFIRSLTAFRAEADIFRARRRTCSASASIAARPFAAALETCLFALAVRCGKFFTSAAISAFSSSYLCSAPLRAISRMWEECLAIADDHM
jgi:hypothetical protein